MLIGVKGRAENIELCFCISLLGEILRLNLLPRHSRKPFCIRNFKIIIIRPIFSSSPGGVNWSRTKFEIENCFCIYFLGELFALKSAGEMEKRRKREGIL